MLMKRALAGGLFVAFATAALVSFAGAATPQTQPSTTWVDKTGHYEITIPNTWQTVPRSVVKIKQLIATYKKKKTTLDLADAYQQILSTSAGKQGLVAYVFQAFDWPQSQDTPIPTEVSVGITNSSKTLTAKDLPGIGATYANELASNPGSKIRVPKIVTLPSGKAEFIIGTIPAGSYTNGVELYLIPHGKKLYTLAFQIDARALASAKLFDSVAHLFKIT
jgi:hypothetical protein